MITEVISAMLIVVVGILFLNPTHLTMPDSMNSMLELGLIVSFLVFAAYVLKEKPNDERESLHIFMAGRISYLIGIFVLVSGLAIQASMHQIDPWLIYALCGMVLSKILYRIYLRFKM